ncbi:hypothetical protein [Pelobacter propionicus]|nr:hypothetical protein [Pelobacter propionicus]
MSLHHEREPDIIRPQQPHPDQYLPQKFLGSLLFLQGSIKAPL